MVSLGRIVIALLLVANSLSAQIVPRIEPVLRSSGPLSVVRVLGKPHSFHLIVENTEITKEGSRQPGMKVQMKYYQDRQGRTREEGFLPMRPGDDVDPVSRGPSSIEITDPLAGIRYVMNPQTRVAKRKLVQVLRTVEDYGKNGPLGGPDAEQLGTRVIEGVTAAGIRQLLTNPRGDRVEIESWYSPDLPLPVRQRTSDSKLFMERTERLISIYFEEPDATLFQLPMDYVIQDE